MSSNDKSNLLSATTRINKHTLKKYSGYYYSFLYNNANPLDMLLFRGGDTISDSIRVLSEKNNGNGDFSHAGMIVTKDMMPYIDNMKKNKLYIWEATMSYSLFGLTDGVPDLETNKGRFGIQIRDLEKVVDAYVEDSDKKAMAWCKLTNNPWLKKHDENISDTISRRKDITRKIKQLHTKIGRTGFERNPFAVISAFIPFTKPLRIISDNLIVGGIEAISWLSDEADEIFQDIHSRLNFAREAINKNKALFKAEQKHNNKKNNDKKHNDKKYNDKKHNDDVHKNIIDNEAKIIYYGSHLADKQSSRWLFCSEMVALIYIELGIMNKNIDPADVLPTDMISDDKIKVSDKPILIFPDEK